LIPKIDVVKIVQDFIVHPLKYSSRRETSAQDVKKKKGGAENFAFS